MRFVVLDPLHRDRLAFGVQTNLHFREIEIERTLLEPLFAQERRQFPGHVEPLADLVFGGRLEQRVCFAVGQAPRTADYRAAEAATFRSPILCKFKEDGMREPVHVRPQAANAVAQPLRQHRDDAVGEINAVPPLVSFAIER
jgi:hypothetical protein